MPASTSPRTFASVSLSRVLSLCSSSTVSARRIVMPEEIIVESCLVATASSLALTRLKSSTLSSLERYLWAISSTIRPRSLS